MTGINSGSGGGTSNSGSDSNSVDDPELASIRVT